MKTSISVIVLTHNDEDRIVDCLEQLDFADELIIVDDNSTDRTVDLAKGYTSKIFQHPLDGNFASQRNFALDKAKGDWVLFVDSDEFITQKLKEEIIRALNKSHSAYFVKRTDVIWGQKILHGEAGKTKLVRFAKRNTGKWHGKVHEVWRVSGTKGEFESELLHSPHQSVSEFVSEIDSYSTLRAAELKEKGIKTSVVQIVLFPVGKFIVGYFVKGGYKDGLPGFLYALIMSFHSFLVRSKLYLLK